MLGWGVVDWRAVLGWGQEVPRDLREGGRRTCDALKAPGPVS